MQLQTTGKVLHVGPISNVLRQGENNADAPVITLPASYNGLDLAGLTFVIYADSEVGTRASQTLQKQISGTTIELTWQITSDFTSVPGKLDIILKGYNTENQVVIKWIGDYPIKVTADEGELSAENPPPEYTQALNEMYEILEQTQAIAQYPPLIGENDNWMLYDTNAQGYIDSQKPSRGDTGPQGNPGPKGDPGLGLPTPTIVDVGKVPMVNPMGDGYELGEVASDAYTKTESDARYAPIAAAIRPTVTGETISVNDSVEWPLQGLTLYGKSTQDGTPTPETPVPIVSTGDNGSIEITISGENIFDPENLTLRNVEKREDDFFFKGLGNVSLISLPVNNISTNDKLSLTYTAWTSDGGEEKLFSDFYPDIYGGDVVNTIVSEKTTKSYSFSPKIDIDSCEFRMYIPYGSLPGQSPIYLSKEIMLVRGAQPKPYSPFVSQKLNVNLINNLFGIPVDSGGNYTDADGQQWICDEVDFGMGTHTQRIGKISSYNSEAVGNIWMSTTGQLTPGATVLYKLDNPIVSNLDTDMIADYKALTTYAPVTNIMTDSTPSAGLSVRYVADAQKYIDNKLSTINTQLLEVKTNV